MVVPHPSSHLASDSTLQTVTLMIAPHPAVVPCCHQMIRCKQRPSSITPHPSSLLASDGTMQTLTLMIVPQPSSLLALDDMVQTVLSMTAPHPATALQLLILRSIDLQIYWNRNFSFLQ